MTAVVPKMSATAPKKKSEKEAAAAVAAVAPPTAAAKEGAKKKSRPAVSKSTKAKLELPVSRVLGLMRAEKSASRMADTAAVFMTAISEYLVAEAINGAGIAAKKAKCKRLTAAHLIRALGEDEDLSSVFKGTTIAGGGVVVDEVQRKKASSKKKDADEEEEAGSAKEDV